MVATPTRRTFALLGAGLFAFVLWRLLRTPFPEDTTPEGAYLRIGLSLARDDLKGCFPYLERDAQWASYTIRDARRDASLLIAEYYPDTERTSLLAEYKPFGDLADGSDVFAKVARTRGWAERLRKDLSGVQRTEIDGERATVVTTRGTRYPFRRRENGIWGLTIFTAELIAESERAARDLELVKRAASDYARSPK